MANRILRRQAARHLLPWIVCSAAALVSVHYGLAETFVVTTTADTGPGSLRQAILDANGNGTEDRIHFRISGTGVRTISPASPLPPLIEPVVIDGTTQTGYTNRPLIELNGTSAGIVSGLRVLASSTIRGLIINRFQLDGIRVEGEATNVIQGNYIGTDATGTLARGNAQQGILLMNAGGTLVGGTNGAQRNLISGNGDSGVYMLMGGGHTVSGNYIGTTLNGESRLPNSNNGVTVYSSSGNVVGGQSNGARNIISGNTGSGVYLYGSGSSENTVQGNYIGTSWNGLAVVSNAADGITVYSGSMNLLGGTNGASGNVISGNGKAGVFLFNANANTLQGNLVGTDVSGKTDLGNAYSGITMLGASNNIVGGLGAAATRNVISGNTQDGITLMTNCLNNIVQNNYIGVNLEGTRPLGNKYSGITILDSYHNLIGHNSGAGRNVISGNWFYGIQMTGKSTGNQLAGNFIGTDLTGTVGVENKRSGVLLQAPGNLVGGPALDFRNVISGNSQNGVGLDGTGAANNIIEYNFIGTSALSTSPVVNMHAGIRITGAPSNTVARNIISGNERQGIYLSGRTAGYNRFQGNTMGTDKQGRIAVPNKLDTILIEDGGTNSVGGSASGEGNHIAGNLMTGMFLTNTSGNVIQGNTIGFAGDGVTGLGNKYHGVELGSDALRNLVGGRLPGEANKVGFAQTVYSGVRVRPGAYANSIVGNEIRSNGPDGGLGIDLGAFQPTLNDVCDVDTGANGQQNFPVLSHAVRALGTAVKGTLNSAAGKTYTLQFYANASCDTSGYGEGELYLGEITIFANTCDVPFVANLPIQAPSGSVITATATDSEGNTSEFSMCVPAQAAPTLNVQVSADHKQMSVSWPAAATGLVLKETQSLSPPVQWSPLPMQPTITSGVATVKLPIPVGNRFYTLAFE